ncbi:MAG: hypothetical protein HY871_04175 [Chloroflexi bacterium]|nr:hypothetical protein [Chloroflexota bacterium]
MVLPLTTQALLPVLSTIPRNSDTITTFSTGAGVKPARTLGFPKACRAA